MLPPAPNAGAGFDFDKRLEGEEAVLESLLTALARGQLKPETWDKVHEAARRDDRVSELAFAYESVSQGKRLKTVPPAVLAEFMFRAAMFFGDVLGDEFGATTYLERTLLALPTHAAAFDRLEAVLTKAGDTKKVAELYASGAQHRARTEQIALLRKAAELFEHAPGSEEKAVELYQQLLRLDPADEGARNMLEARYLRANRHRDVARLLEQALATMDTTGPAQAGLGALGPDTARYGMGHSDGAATSTRSPSQHPSQRPSQHPSQYPPAPVATVDEAALKLRGRLIELYAGQLHEPERTMPHIEAILASYPAHEEARRVAMKLLSVKGLAARAAAALADAYDADLDGDPLEVAKYLALELEHTRGPKRLAVLRRAGILKQDRLEDPNGAYDSFEAALALDPSDDEVRTRYAALAGQLGRVLDAARTLARVGTAAKDASVRARLTAEMGELLRAGGDVKRARTTFLSVLSTPSADGVATLKAARALAEIYETEKDYKALADVLERIAAVEPDLDRMRDANERIAELASSVLKDPARAIAAWRKLVNTDARPRALQALEPLYEAAGDVFELAYVLDQRATDASEANDLVEARMLAFRAAEVLTRTPDEARAAEAWRKLVEKYGASRDVLVHWLPLLESQKQWPELAEALSAEAQLAPEIERAGILARLAHVRLLRTREVELALDTFRKVLASDPQEKTSRATLEKMLPIGENRLAAALVLEPIYRADDNTAGLLKVLEIKAASSSTAPDRLASLDEATRVAEANPAYLSRAIEFAGKGLAEAVQSRLTLAPWLERMDRLANAGIDPKRRASILVKALGDQRVETPDLLTLARSVGESLADVGDVNGALKAYRSALTFEPSSGDLIGRVDELLRDQGNPRERVALYRATLEQGVDAKRRRELLHNIGTIERNDLQDVDAAIEAYKSAIADDADDEEAHTALVGLYTQTAAWTLLCDRLEARAERTHPDEGRRIRAQLADVAASHGDPVRAEAQCRIMLSDSGITSAELETIERVAATIDDVDLTHTVLLRRATDADDPREQMAWLEKVAALELKAMMDPLAAATTWKRAAEVAASLDDDDAARALYTRVHEVLPDDFEAAERLLELLERAAMWAETPELYNVLLTQSADSTAATTRAHVALLMRLSRVYGDRLGDEAGAMTAAERAFALDASDRDVLAHFEQLSVLAGSVASFVMAIDTAVKKADGEDLGLLRADLRMAKARVLSVMPTRLADAAETYRAILLEPIDDARARSATAAFEALMEVRGNDRDALADRRWLSSWRVDHAAEGERVGALMAWAAIEEFTLEDSARALELHRRVLELDPESAETLAAVARLALVTGDVHGAVTALIGRRDRSEGEARTALDLEIATILLDRTERLAEALSSVSAVLEVTPNDETALLLSARLLAAPATRAQAVTMLERAFETAEDDDVRGQILERLLADLSSPPERRQDWYERLLDLLENQEKTAEAHDVVLRAAEQLPGVPGLWDRAEGLARSLEQPDAVAKLFHRVLSARELAKDDALELGKRAVAFYEEWFEDSDRVVAILERILEIDPNEAWAFDRLKLLFDSAERWDDLFALYDRALLAADDKKKIELLEDAAQIAKDFANLSKRAIGYLEQLLLLKPGNARLAASLERLYERHGCHRELIALLTASLPQLTSHKDSQETRARIAALWLDELGDATNAILSVEDMLAREPDPSSRDKGEAPNVDVSGLLERILSMAPPQAELREPTRETRDGEPSEKRRDTASPGALGPKRMLVRQRAAALLKERYVEQGREGDLVRILEVELEAVKNAKERIRRHHQIATLYSGLGNESSAMEHYVSLVLLEPDVAAHRNKLGELATQVGREDRLAEVLVAAAEDCTDEALRVDLLMQAAIVHTEKLKDAERAIDLFFRILLISPIADTALLSTCRRIEPLLLEAGRSRERLDVLERLALLEPEPQVKREVLGTTAYLATELGANDRAVWAWEARLGLFPEDEEALNGLVTLLEHDGRWRPLMDVLRKRAAAFTKKKPLGSLVDPRADRVRVATILSTELGETDEAIASWREVDKEYGESDESTQALVVLLKSARKWPELAQLLERAAERAESAGKAALLRELGDVQRQHLNKAADAIESYARAIESDPKDEGARAGLTALLGPAELRAAAIVVLLGAYETTDEWQPILELTEHRLSVAQTDAESVEILMEAAKIAEDRKGDPEAAFSTTRRAFLFAPSDGEIEAQLVRLAETTRQWRSLAEAQREALEGREGSTSDAAWLTPLRFKMGDVLETKLDDPRAALAAYMRVASETPKNLDAARATIRVAARTMRWDAAAKVVVESSRALERLQPELIRAAEEAATAAGAWDAATGAFAAAVPHDDGATWLARDLEGRIATWHRDRRGDPDAAEAALVRALAYEGGNAELLGALTQLQRRSKGRPLVESLLRLSNATSGDLDLLREAAEVATTAVGDRALAKSILEKLLKLATERWLGVEDPDGPVTAGNPASPHEAVEWTIGELVRIHDEEGDADRIVDLLVETARLPFEAHASRNMRHEAARIATERLNDSERAIGLYLGLFEENPEDDQAVAKLVALYEASGQKGELLALKQKQIATAKTPARRVVLRLEAATLLLTLSDVAGCIRALHENLAEDPRHTATVVELVRVFEREAAHALLAELLADQATRAEADNEPRHAADLWARAAEVAEEHLGTMELAIQHHRRVIALEPRPSALDALARLSTSRGDHAGAAEFLDQLRSLATPEERAPVTLRLAEALCAAGAEDVARERLEEAIAETPDAEAVRTRVAEMYRAKENWQPLALLLTSGAAHAPDKATRLARLREAADLHHGRCGDPTAAIPLLEQASDLDPEDRSIKLALGDALGAAGRFADARTLLRALVDGFAGRRPKERAPVHYHLARLDLAVGDRARALIELDSATRIDPANPEILRALAELARDDAQYERAERSYRALLSVLRRHDDATPAPIVRSEVLLELSGIALLQGETERSNEILESALEAATASELESRRLERALRLRGAHLTLVRALEARLARIGDVPAAAEGLTELADVLDGELGRKEEALTARLRAVALAPASTAVHDAALAIARREGAIQKYIDHLTALAKTTESTGPASVACDLLLRLGAVVEEESGDDVAVAALYERAQKLGVDARGGDVLRALDRLYERIGDADAQARVLAARVELEESEGQTTSDALFRLAGLRLRMEGTVDEGCDLLVSALDREPSYERAEVILKVATETHPKSERVLELYERVGRQPGHERALVDALSRRWELLNAGPETIREAVTVGRTIGEPELAESLLRIFLGRASHDGTAKEHLAWALVTLADLRLAANDVADAARHKRDAALVSEPDAARKLRFEVAKLAADSLDELELAASMYESLHETEPADREAWEPLLAVYRRMKAGKKLADLISSISPYVDDIGERSRLRLERVRTSMDKLGMKDDDAVPELREIVDEDPSQVDAAILLAGILERTGRDDELADLLAKQLDAAKDRSEAAAVASLSTRLGALLEKRSPPDAKNVYYAGLEWDGSNRELLLALIALHAASGETSDKADVMERLLALEQGEAAEKLAVELSAMRSELWDEDGAERALETGFKAHPGSATLRERLETAYRERSNWAKLAELYVLEASARTDVEQRLARLGEAATLYANELSDPVSGAAVLREARNVAPANEDIITRLVEMLVQADDIAGAEAEVTVAIAQHGADSPSNAMLLARRAALRSKLDDHAGALADMERAYTAAGETYARDLADYLEASGARADAAGDDAQSRSIRLRLAELLPTTGDVDGARALLTDLLKHDVKDRDALRALARLEENAGRWDAASASYRRLVALEEGEAVVSTALRLADACERAGRLGDARGGLERARLAAPANEALRKRLEHLYEQTAAYRELAEMSLEDAKDAREVAGRFTHLLRAGTLFLQQGGDVQVAIAPLEEAHALRPADLDCIVRLSDAYMISGRAAEAAELLNATIAQHRGRRSKELAPLHHRVSRVARANGDPIGEIAALAAALDMDGQNGVIASELAAVCMNEGQLEMAQRALRSVTMLKGPAPMSKALAYQYLGEIARQQGDRKRAILMLKRAVDDDPNLLSARTLLDEMQAAD